MSHSKHRVLICSPSESFVSAFRGQLDTDFELQMATTQEVCEFLAKDWLPHIALIDGDQFANMTPTLRQILSYRDLGIIVISQSEGVFKEEFALRSGADHFLYNPTDYKSIVWRIISLMRRIQGVSPGVSPHSPDDQKPASSITFEGLKIYPQDFLVKSGGQLIKITPIQFKLLVAFITHADQLLTRNWIQTNIWEGAEISPRSIDAQISKLKKVVPQVGKNIINVYGQGYILTPNSPKAA